MRSRRLTYPIQPPTGWYTITTTPTTEPKQEAEPGAQVSQETKYQKLVEAYNYLYNELLDEMRYSESAKDAFIKEMDRADAASLRVIDTERARNALLLSSIVLFMTTVIMALC